MLVGAIAVAAVLVVPVRTVSASGLVAPPAVLQSDAKPREPTAFEAIMDVNKLASSHGAPGAEVELTQGDIAVSDVVREAFRFRRVKRGATARQKLWPKNSAGNAVIPYVIESSAAGITARIKAGINHWTKHVPCLRFVPRTTQADFISFFRGNGCYSFVGRVGRRQQISIGSGCEQLGTVVHEIGHALGFWHEQSRPDRDNFVTIHWKNIPRGFRDNFRKRPKGDIKSLGEPYDYKSVMHYDSKAFGVNGAVTITRIDGSENLGNNNGLSRLDVRQAKKLYKCGVSIGCAYSDKNRYCAHWARRGYCAGSVYTPFVQRQCQKSCKC